MGMFNNFSKFTAKVVAKFKNTGSNKGKIHVPYTATTSTEDKAKGSTTIQKRKSYKRRPDVHNKYFRKIYEESDRKGLLRPMKNFGTFAPIYALPNAKYIAHKRFTDRSLRIKLSKVIRVFFPKSTPYLNKTERLKLLEGNIK